MMEEVFAWNFCISSYTERLIHTLSAYDAGINFDKRHGGGRPKGAAAAGRGTGGEPVFCCCVQSVISLMKWSKIQGGIAMDGNFRKLAAWMPLASDPIG